MIRRNHCGNVLLLSILLENSTFSERCGRVDVNATVTVEHSLKLPGIVFYSATLVHYESWHLIRSNLPQMSGCVAR